MKYLLCALLIFISPLSVEAATNTSATNNGDTFIYQGLVNDNFSTDTNLTIGRNGAWIQRPLMKWTLPSGSGTITKITLYLYADTVVGSNTNASVYNILRSDMSPSQATWNVYKTSTNWTTAGAAGAGTDYNSTAIDTTAIPAAGNWQSFDLYGGSSDSPLSITWGSTFDLLIRGTVETGTNYVQYRSNEHGTSNTRPYIEITYTPAAQEDIIWFYF